MHVYICVCTLQVKFLICHMIAIVSNLWYAFLNNLSTYLIYLSFMIIQTEKVRLLKITENSEGLSSPEICGYNLTHWGRVTHICVGKTTIIGSDNGLSPYRHQAIIWTNAGILLSELLGSNFSEILIEIHTFSFTKMHLKMSSGKWRTFCLGLNVLKCAILQSIWGICIFSISWEIALWWMTLDPISEKSILVQVMAWCHKTTSQYLNQCWSCNTIGITRPKLVNSHNHKYLNDVSHLHVCKVWQKRSSCGSSYSKQ